MGLCEGKVQYPNSCRRLFADQNCRYCHGNFGVYRRYLTNADIHSFQGAPTLHCGRVTAPSQKREELWKMLISPCVSQSTAPNVPGVLGATLMISPKVLNSQIHGYPRYI